MNTALIADPTRSRQILERIPSARWGTPEDFTAAILFLAGKGSDYVCGECVTVSLAGLNVCPERVASADHIAALCSSRLTADGWLGKHQLLPTLVTSIVDCIRNSLDSSVAKEDREGRPVWADELRLAAHRLDVSACGKSSERRPERHALAFDSSPTMFSSACDRQTLNRDPRRKVDYAEDAAGRAESDAAPAPPARPFDLTPSNPSFPTSTLDSQLCSLAVSPKRSRSGIRRRPFVRNMV